MKIAKEKVWKTSDGDLVEDGNPKAAVLVAVRGQSVSDIELSRLRGVDKFFAAVNPKVESAKLPVETSQPVRVGDSRKSAKNKK